MALDDRVGGGGGGERGGGAEAAGTCACGCPCCSSAWQRSQKRKLGESDGDSPFVENEAAALSEALSAREQTIQMLLRELEEERNASSSAAAAAMSMIDRLQEEKAEAEMEVLQYGRMVEETMDHDQQEIASLEDRLVKRDHVVQALSWEIQGYRHRLLSYGIDVDGDMPPSEPQTPVTATGTATPVDTVPQFDPFPTEYPPLRCIDDSSTDLDLYPSPETPPEDIEVFQPRVFPIEQVGTSSFKEKGVVARQSPPRRSRDLESFSYASVVGSFDNGDGYPEAAEDCSSEGDRVYTVDAVYVAREDSAIMPPKEVRDDEKGGGAEKEAEIKKLQALKADKESMRQTLISMSMDKAQLALLKDITRMFKEAASEKKVLEKQPSSKKPSIMSICKSVVSVMLWKKRSSCRIKHTFGLSPSNSGLTLLLDKSSPRLRLRRVLTKAQG